jgi:uncharacterized BrkB/YihY/UPF0761 family membrane protein
LNLGPLKYVGPWGPYFWFKDNWIVGRFAARLFSFSAVLIVVWTVAFAVVSRHGTSANQTRPIWHELWTCLDIGVVLPIFFLWFGMWRYWLRVDRSKPWIKRLSFVALLLGAWWGATVYCLAIYLPRTLGQAPQEAKQP